MSNLPVGFFGLLKGRVTNIDTVWFDGERWIERNYIENGDVVYNEETNKFQGYAGGSWVDLH